MLLHVGVGEEGQGLARQRCGQEQVPVTYWRDNEPVRQQAPAPLWRDNEPVRQKAPAPLWRDNGPVKE